MRNFIGIVSLGRLLDNTNLAFVLGSQQWLLNALALPCSNERHHYGGYRRVANTINSGVELENNTA